MSKHSLSYQQVRCPFCGATSKLLGTHTATMLHSEPVFDANAGEWHRHDPNTMRGLCGCPNGHAFHADFGYECKCGWNSKRA